MICWLPNPVPPLSVLHFPVRTTPSFTLSLAFATLLSPSVPSRSAGLAPLPLTSENWCPLTISAQLLCLSTVPSLSVQLHSFPGFHLSCLKMTIKSAPSSHASHLHIQLIFSGAYLQVFSNWVSQKPLKFNTPKEKAEPASLSWSHCITNHLITIHQGDDSESSMSSPFPPAASRIT